jgi:hypothetical protein
VKRQVERNVMQLTLVQREMAKANESLLSVHKAGCKDLARDARNHSGYIMPQPEDMDLKAVLKEWFSDIASDDPDYYTEDFDWTREADVFPCARS